MSIVTSEMPVRMGAAAGALILSLSLMPAAARAQDKTYVMKVTTATLNDAPHQFIKDFAAAVERDSQVASSLRSIPRAN